MSDKLIDQYLKSSLTAVDKLAGIKKDISNAADIIIDVYKKGGKIIVFGNGGSAADSQHFATELVARFRKDREALDAIALTTNSSMLTAIGNDNGFNQIFKRQLEAAGNKEDCIIAISTSGNSENVVEAVKAAKKIGSRIISFTGRDGGKLQKYSDVTLKPDADLTSHIQECHLIIYHLLCNILEEKLF